MLERLFKISVPILLSLAAVLPLIGCGKAGESTARFTPVGAEHEVRGTVTDAKLTVCAPAADKVGTCEGTLVIEPSGAGAAGRIPVEVTRDVLLTKGGQAVLLPQLRGGQVVVKYRATKEGPSLATSVVGQ
jgi:hypothetical protein